MKANENTLAVFNGLLSQRVQELYGSRTAVRGSDSADPVTGETKFSERLSETIESRGMTRKRVAELTYTTEATISRYCSGARTPQVLETLTRLTGVLDVSADYLLGTTNIREREESRTAEEQVFLDIWPDVTSSDRKILMAVLEKYMSRAQKEQIRESRNPAVRERR